MEAYTPLGDGKAKQAMPLRDKWHQCLLVVIASLTVVAIVCGSVLNDSLNPYSVARLMCSCSATALTARSFALQKRWNSRQIDGLELGCILTGAFCTFQSLLRSPFLQTCVASVLSSIFSVPIVRVMVVASLVLMLMIPRSILHINVRSSGFVLCIFMWCWCNEANVQCIVSPQDIHIFANSSINSINGLCTVGQVLDPLGHGGHGGESQCLTSCPTESPPSISKLTCSRWDAQWFGGLKRLSWACDCPVPLDLLDSCEEGNLILDGGSCTPNMCVSGFYNKPFCANGSFHPVAAADMCRPLCSTFQPIIGTAMLKPTEFIAQWMNQSVFWSYTWLVAPMKPLISRCKSHGFESNFTDSLFSMQGPPSVFLPVVDSSLHLSKQEVMTRNHFWIYIGAIHAAALPLSSFVWHTLLIRIPRMCGLKREHIQSNAAVAPKKGLKVLFLLYIGNHHLFCFVLVNSALSGGFLSAKVGFDWEYWDFWYQMLLIALNLSIVVKYVANIGFDLPLSVVDVAMSIVPAMGNDIHCIKDWVFIGLCFQKGSCDPSACGRIAGYSIGAGSILSMFLPYPGLLTDPDLGHAFMQAHWATVAIKPAAPAIANTGERSDWKDYAIRKAVVQSSSGKKVIAEESHLPQGIFEIAFAHCFGFSSFVFVALAMSFIKLFFIRLVREFLFQLVLHSVGTADVFVQVNGVESLDLWGESLLFHAVRAKNLPIVQSLVKQRCNVCRTNLRGKSALDALDGNISGQMFDVLATFHPDPQHLASQALCATADKCGIVANKVLWENMNRWVHRGADVNQVDLLQKVVSRTFDKNDEMGDDNIVKHLMDARADAALTELKERLGVTAAEERERAERERAQFEEAAWILWEPDQFPPRDSQREMVERGGAMQAEKQLEYLANVGSASSGFWSWLGTM